VKNPKVIISTVAVGFFLSFVVALFSGAGFGNALIRAFVSAIVCGVVVAGCIFISRKFLLEGAQGADVAVADDTAEAPVGGRVNIVLDDETLPTEPDDPRFDVSGIRKSIANPPKKAVVESSAWKDDFGEDGILDSPAAVSYTQTAGSTTNAASKIKSQTVAERISAIDDESPRKKTPEFGAAGVSAAQNNSGVPSVSGKTASVGNSTPPPQPRTSGVSLGTGGLVDLPDIDEFMAEDLSTGGEVIEDSDFASATKQEVAAGHKIKAENFDATDSQAIASAIRTLLVSG
jgi:hypothetical protein